VLRLLVGEFVMSSTVTPETGKAIPVAFAGVTGARELIWYGIIENTFAMLYRVYKFIKAKG